MWSKKKQSATDRWREGAPKGKESSQPPKRPADNRSPDSRQTGGRCPLKPSPPHPASLLLSQRAAPGRGVNARQMNFLSSFWGPIFHTNVKEERREDHFPIQLLGGEADEEESTQPFPPYNSFPVLKCAMKAYISRIGGYLLVEKV